MKEEKEEEKIRKLKMAFGPFKDPRRVTTPSLWKNQGWVGRDLLKNLYAKMHNPMDTVECEGLGWEAKGSERGCRLDGASGGWGNRTCKVFNNKD